MFVIEFTEYGGPDVLSVVSKPAPVPDENQILIRVLATSATTADYRVRSMDLPDGFKLLGRLLYGWNKPRIKILGGEAAGVVEKVGGGVKDFKVGDEVVLQLGASFGAYQEYLVIDPQKSAVVHKPRQLSFVEAGTISFGATTAFCFLREKFKLPAGSRLLIWGASGSVGTAAVQIASRLGAHVTAASRPENTDLLKSLGAENVVDYRNNDIDQLGQFDVIMDCAGFSSRKNELKRLKRGGHLLLVSGGPVDILAGLVMPLVSSKRIVSGPVMDSKARLQAIMDMVEKEQYKTVVDQVFPISQIREAHQYLDSRHRRGNIAIDFQQTT